MSASDQSHESLMRRLGAICAERGIAYETNVPIGETPFGKPFRADLILRDVPGHGELPVIARYQERGGSVEQKLPFLAMAITRSRRACLVVLDGPGWSSGARDWMAARQGDRVLDTVDLDGFDAFLVAALRP